MAQDAESPIKEKWEHDHLDRVQVARFLTQYLNSIYEESNSDLSNGHFVLNLNANWGQGKTFLLTKWEEDLAEANYPVVRFDAWANDFSRDPLVGFMSELYKALDPWLRDIAPAKAAMQKMKKSAAKVIGASVGIFAGGAAAALTEAGLNMLTGKCDVSETATDTVSDKAGVEAGKLAERALKDHKTTQKAIADFKDNLAKLIKAIERNTKGKKLPIYIFVDELDRCRPTYAIELLENIKHLFGVRGVFFVIATNKEQLCHSIGAVYGSGFDSSTYLGRFFDQEYTLPAPDNLRFANHLFAKYKLEEDDRLFVSMKKDNSVKGSHLARVFATFTDAFDLPLRDQEQTMHRLKAILSVNNDSPVYFDYLIFLLMLRRCSESLFDDIGEKATSDWSDIGPRLRKIFTDSTICVGRTTYHGGHVGESQETLTALIKVYSSFSKKDLSEIWKAANAFEEGKITDAIIYREALKSRNMSGKHSLTKYSTLVKQAGQLS